MHERSGEKIYAYLSESGSYFRYWSFYGFNFTGLSCNVQNIYNMQAENENNDLCFRGECNSAHSFLKLFYELNLIDFDIMIKLLILLVNAQC